MSSQSLLILHRIPIKYSVVSVDIIVNQEYIRPNTREQGILLAKPTKY